MSTEPASTGSGSVPEERPREEVSGAPFRLLFVCTGNTCRSPMAAAQARASLAARGWSQLHVGSAGVAAQAGDPASEGARRAAERHGLELEGHAATPLTAELLVAYDLVLTMGTGHLAVVDALGAGERAAPITSFARSGGGDAVAADGGVRDPFGGSDEVYEATWLELQALVEQVLDRLGPLVEP